MRFLPIDKVIEAIEQSDDDNKSRYQNHKELRERIEAIEPINIYDCESRMDEE